MIMPHTSSVPLPWRLRRNRYVLIGSVCSTCSSIFFPPRALCPNCVEKGEIKEKRLFGLGEVVSFTKINAAPKGFENQTPYTVVVIKLDSGPIITAQITNSSEQAVVGKRASPVFRKMHTDKDTGLITYGIKFRVLK